MEKNLWKIRFRRSDEAEILMMAGLASQGNYWKYLGNRSYIAELSDEDLDDLMPDLCSFEPVL